MRRVTFLLALVIFCGAIAAAASEPNRFSLTSGSSADPLTLLGPAVACADNIILRNDTTTPNTLQCSALTVADATGDIAAPGALAFTTGGSAGSFTFNPGGTGGIALYGPLSGQPASTVTTGAGLGFTNQPSSDGVEVVSSQAADTTQVVTIIGTTTGTDTVVVETVTLNGTTFVPTVKVNWGFVLAAKLSGAATGTVTIRKATGDSTITTMAPGSTAVGVEVASLTIGSRYVLMRASSTSTAQLGLRGTSVSGIEQYDSQQLTDGTPVLSNSQFETVTEIYTGSLSSALTATVSAPFGGALEVAALAGSATGSGTFVSDGDPSVVGEVTTTGDGQLRPSGGLYIRSNQAVSSNIILQAGSNGTSYFSVGNNSLDAALSTPGFISVLGSNIAFYTTDSGIEFEGSSKDGYEVVLTSEDATADRLVKAPNADGVLIVREGIGRTYSMGDAAAVNIFAVTLATGDTGCSIDLSYSYFVTDTTETAVHSGTAFYAITNDDGTVSGTVAAADGAIHGTGCDASCETFSGGAASTVYTATAAFDNSLSATGTLKYNVLMSTCSAVSFSP